MHRPTEVFAERELYVAMRDAARLPLPKRGMVDFALARGAPA